MVVTSGMMAPSSSSSIGGCAGSFGVMRVQRRGGRVRCASASAGGSLIAQYRTLRVQPGASELEVKRAFRQLALQYHPDVCKGSNCSVQFHSINEAYDIVMSNLRQAEEETAKPVEWNGDGGDDESMRGNGTQTGTCGRNGWGGRGLAYETTAPISTLTPEGSSLSYYSTLNYSLIQKLMFKHRIPFQGSKNYVYKPPYSNWER